ncbi:hypothetical protein QFC21_000671 [Naganishia friedmannii]|uniref:Uncharacterized protein n=1 Tax=Naganishia friedmannii TaxID=89922 RepID=A0ACC2WCG7_9TREE|nr:hypothetical protein QFC21_000671 [Naganishia friedmannii]
MNTKGVDSVRSPVANLIGIRRDITQDEFVHQVANSFQHVFSTGDLSADSFQQLLKNKPVPDVQVVEVDQGRVLGAGDERAGKIRADMEGLKTWEWTFGQTPEFSITLVDKLTFGDIKVHITSKHAIITHCVIETSAVNQGLQGTIAELQSKLVGQRYDDVPPISDAGDRTGTTIESEIRTWLRRSV